MEDSRHITLDLATGDWLEHPAKGVSFVEALRCADTLLPGYDIPALIQKADREQDPISPWSAVAVVGIIALLLFGIFYLVLG